MSIFVIQPVRGSVVPMRTPIGCLGSIIAKGMNLSVHSQAELDKVERQVNKRQRKTLNFATPAKSLKI
jgi:hypothetical protein